MPAQAGIQGPPGDALEDGDRCLDFRLRGNDGKGRPPLIPPATILF